jgi:response regulator RpfG family c-di-GMP phosphodiesterase
MEYNGKTISLLYVDDEPANLFLFKASFQNSFKVYTATSGTEGLTILDKKPGEIIVVISDMRMPKMNGVEFIRAAKSKHGHVAYFILTGFDFNEEIEEALKDGLINKFFTKPFDTNLIESAIEDFVSKQP